MMKPIPGYSRYKISREGVIQSFCGPVPRTIKPSLEPGGYPLVFIVADDGVRRTRRMHQLVMHTWVGPQPPGMHVRHLNGDNTDYRLENLVYGTQSENELDKVRHGRHFQAKKTHCPAGHPYDEANTHTRSDRPNVRACRTCKRNNAEAYNERRRAARRVARQQDAA